jgi:hypothetical protein
MAKLAVNKIQDAQGFSASMESAFADFLVMSRLDGHPPKPPKDRRLQASPSRSVARWARGHADQWRT